MPRSLPVRTVDPTVVWRTALNCLGRMACIYKDATSAEHDHAECVRDDDSYVADLMLRLLAGVVSDNDDTILARLDDLRAAIAAADE